MRPLLNILGLTVLLLSGSFGLLPYHSPSVAQAQLGKPEGLYYKSWAIIIGIDNYLLAPPIPGAIDEAKQVAQVFRHLGFEEIVEIYNRDASFRRLHQVLSDMLPRKVGRMDRLVIFYIGHAGTTQDADGKDRSYLVPMDAQVNNIAKSVTLEHLKEFTRRSASKHILLILDAPVYGWETTAPQPSSLEGRVAQETDAERRAVQVISSTEKGEMSFRSGGKSLFVQALLTGLAGAADLNKNGWLMASELGTYLVQQVDAASKGTQHPTSLRIDGDGDMVLIEGR